ncbi:unnamed protein product [Eretmochelys imbricata]
MYGVGASPCNPEWHRGGRLTQGFISHVQQSNAGLVSPLGAAFVGKHRDRMGQIQPVLVRLRVAQLLSSEGEEEVRSEQTSRMMNDALLQLVERKGARAQQELYQTLRETDPYLVQDLEQSS